MTWRNFKIEHHAYALLNKTRLESLERESIAMICDFARNRDGVLQLSFSGGKDSVLMYHLAQKAGVDFVPIWFADAPVPGTLEMMEMHQVKLVHHTNWYDEYMTQYREPPQWSRRPQMDAVIDEQRELDNLFGFKGTLVGMRRDESRIRRYALKNPVIQAKEYAGGWRCAPLASWRLNDAWAYILKNNLPTHTHYQKTLDSDMPNKHMRVDALPTLFCATYPSAVNARNFIRYLYSATYREFLEDNPYLPSR